MNCNELKKWLGNRELFDTTVAEKAKKHMEQCDLCKKLYSMDSLIEAQLKQGLKQIVPPERLFDRIEMNLQSTKEYEFSDHFAFKRLLAAPWKVIVTPVAIAAMLLLFLNPFGKGFNSLKEIGKLTVNDHLGNLSMTFNAGEINDIPGWFENRIGFRIQIPDMAEQGLKLAGGRKCHLGKNDVAYLLYERDGKRASLFIIEKDDLNFVIEKKGRYHMAEQGCEVQFWKNANLLYALVE